MHICEKCGKIYEDEDCLITEYDTLTERTTVEYEGCICGGALVPAKKCEKCDEWMPDNSHSLCEDCANEYATLDTVLEIGADWENKVSLNGFLTSIFGKEEIELILMDTLTAREEGFAKKAIKAYCEEDVEYFLGVVDKKWKEEK